MFPDVYQHLKRGLNNSKIRIKLRPSIRPNSLIFVRSTAVFLLQFHFDRSIIVRALLVVSCSPHLAPWISYVSRLWLLLGIPIVFCTVPVSILHKSIAGRFRPVRVADGPITARGRFINNASWSSPFDQHVSDTDCIIKDI